MTLLFLETRSYFAINNVSPSALTLKEPLSLPPKSYFVLIVLNMYEILDIRCLPKRVNRYLIKEII